MLTALAMLLPLMTAAPPEPFALGGPCGRSTRRAPGPGTTWCDSNARVVGVFRMGDLLPQPPANAVVVSTPRQIEFSDQSYVAIVGEALWVRRFTCPRCRRPVGWSFVGALASLSDSQLAELQGLLGLKGAPLRSQAEWAAALEQAGPLDRGL